MKRTPLKRHVGLRRGAPLKRGSKPLLRKTPIEPIGRKQMPWHRKYLKALLARKVAQIHATGSTFCELCRTPGKVEGHHTQGRRGANILVFTLICRECHTGPDGIHNNARRSRREGLLK